MLFRFGALCRPNQSPHLCRQLIAIGTTACTELAAKIFNQAAEEDNLRSLKPHLLHVPLHRWVMELAEWDFQAGFYDRKVGRVLEWLLDELWGAEAINLWTIFVSLLTRLKSTLTRHGLDHLYVAAEHIPGSAAEIEKIVFASDFVRQDDRQGRWYKSWDEQIVRAVQFEKCKRALKGRSLPPSEVLAEAASLEAVLPRGEARPLTELVVERLLDEFVQRTHLSVNGSSSLYNPAKARGILDAIAGLRDPQQQMTVLWTINRWPERMRGLGSLMEDSESLTRGLLVPLWWRFSTTTRLEYLRRHSRGLSPHPEWTGQEFLLEDMMGLHYDIDEDFRNTFNASLELYRDPKERGSYEPRPLQELWRDRKLRYELVDECPPELVRRIAVQRVEWENSRPGSAGWAEAKDRAEQLLGQSGQLRQYVSAQRSDYAIDNLLGAYFPAQRRIVFFSKMLHYAASELGIDEEALTTVVYMHETVHAFSHLGRDLNGRTWEGFALPIANSPDEQLSQPHEAIAQFYTFKLLEWLDEKHLIKAFLALEKFALPVYRVWRRTENYSLETMRQVLVRYRSNAGEWPPDRAG